MKYKLNPHYQKKFENFLTDIQSYFLKESDTIHKARNELKIINYEGIESVVKSFKTPNLFNKFIYTFFRDSKAKKSYNNSLKLTNFTPKPIGYIEFFKNRLIDKSYFVSERFVYDFTIREPLLQKDFPHREAIFKAFSRFTLELHNAGIFHNDYSPGNILIKKENDTYIFKVVDINRMSFFQLGSKDRAKNFSKLWADDDVLKIIAQEYTKNYPSDETFLKDVLYYSNKNKKIKNFKKRLKGKKVHD
jgi:hypothetical protein